MFPPTSGSRAETTAQIVTRGVVAVVRLADRACVGDVIEALAAGGIGTVEVTMTVPGAIDSIVEVARALPSGVLLGAGTVLDASTAARAIDAGAQFIVSPVFRREVIAECQRRERAVFPGCFSPTEILDAWEAGADIVKVFPATSVGPGYLKDIRAPLPHIRLMPTGGVTIDNAGEWIRAGAAAVGLGSALVDPALVTSGDWDEITRRAARVMANVAAARMAQP